MAGNLFRWAGGFSEIVLDSVKIEELSDGEDSSVNYARKDVVNLTDYTDLFDFDGSNTIQVATEPSPKGHTDTWILYYSKLTITYSSDFLPVPEPSSMILFSVGVFAFIFFRRQKDRSLIRCER